MWWAFQTEEKNDATCGTQLRGRGIGGACLIQHGGAVEAWPDIGMSPLESRDVTRATSTFHPVTEGRRNVAR